MQPKIFNQTRLLANLMTKGVSKSLTRSVALAGETEIAAAATPTSIRLMWRHDFASPWDDQGHQNCRA